MCRRYPTCTLIHHYINTHNINGYIAEFVYKKHYFYNNTGSTWEQTLKMLLESFFFFFLKQNQRHRRPPGGRAINISFSSRMNSNRWTKHAGQRCQLMIRILSPPGRGDMSLTICHQHCMTGKGSSEWMPYITHSLRRYRPAPTFSSALMCFSWCLGRLLRSF